MLCAMSLQLCLTLCDPSACSLQAPLSVEFPGKNSGVGCHFLLQGIFSTQGLNLCLLPCRWILSCWATKNAHKDYRWNITFKNCEALYCTPVTYIILCINYASKKKMKSNQKQPSEPPVGKKLGCGNWHMWLTESKFISSPVVYIPLFC